MSDKVPISVIILTYNEEKNIEECLKSLQGWAGEIFVVDSGSSDKTLEIAKKYTNKIYQHPFETQAKQFNWALDNLPIITRWIMRLDADEMVTSELANEICGILPGLPPDITGLYVKRRVYFMGKWIKHGGYYPIWLLRIWRKGKAKIEERFMDEHVVLFEGKTAQLRNDIEEKNKKDLTSWIEKHNSYATREAKDMIDIEQRVSIVDNVEPSFFGSQEQRKRWIKENIYSKMPFFIRPFLYFIYRYFFRVGFIDGKEGLIFHFLQGFWYRFLVDAKIYEYRKRARAK